MIELITIPVRLLGYIIPHDNDSVVFVFYLFRLLPLTVYKFPKLGPRDPFPDICSL